MQKKITFFILSLLFLNCSKDTDFTSPSFYLKHSNEIHKIGNYYHDTIAVLHANNSEFIYRLIDSIPGMQLTDSTLSWFPILGSFNIKIAAIDNIKGRYFEFTSLLIISDTNHCPVIISSPDSMLNYALINHLYLDTLYAKDQDGEILTYDLLSNQNWIILENNLITFKPLLSDTGYHNISIQISDLYNCKDTIKWQIRINMKDSLIGDFSPMKIGNIWIYKDSTVCGVSYPNPPVYYDTFEIIDSFAHSDSIFYLVKHGSVINTYLEYQGENYKLSNGIYNKNLYYTFRFNYFRDYLVQKELFNNDSIYVYRESHSNLPDNIWIQNIGLLFLLEQGLGGPAKPPYTKLIQLISFNSRPINYNPQQFTCP